MANSIVRLSVEDSSFNAKIKAAAKAFADFGKNVASAGADAFQKFASGAQTAKVAFQGFNTVLKANALVFVATLAVQVGQAIGEMIGDWISGADEAEAAQRKLNDELDRTAQIVKGILAESDFNARIAKAAGKSTSEILQMKYQAADAAYNKAMAALFDPKVKPGTDEYDKAKKIFDEADKARTKAWQDIQVDNTARENKTGEYAVRGGGSGRREKELDINKIAFKPKDFDESLKFNPEEHAVASGLRPEDILGPSDEWEKYKDTITGSIGSIGESFENLTEWNYDSEEFVKNQKKMIDTAKQEKMAMNMAGAAVNNFGAALANLDDPSTKAAGTVIQAIASIALGFAQAAAAKDTTASGWAWLAWVAAGMAAMATSIATVHSLTGYAQGGMVDGGSFSGDNVPIMANAGEVVLTKAMQGNLASQISDNANNNQLTAVIRGEQLYLTLNRYGMRTGKGEILNTK